MAKRSLGRPRKWVENSLHTRENSARSAIADGRCQRGKLVEC